MVIQESYGLKPTFTDGPPANTHSTHKNPQYTS